jgi:mono/diheme cytochrome c family protein
MAWVLVAVAPIACDGKVAGGRADGARVYDEACARCHGARGVPDPGMVAQIGVKDLTSPRVQRSFSDQDLRRQIVEGSENQKMPSFAGALTDDQIRAVIAHVRGIGSP